jgi:hypothetical protein
MDFLSVIHGKPQLYKSFNMTSLIDGQHNKNIANVL